MSPGDESCFVSEIEFHCKYHLIGNTLVVGRQLVWRIDSLEGSVLIKLLQLLSYSIGPSGVAVMSIKSVGFLGRARYPYAELVLWTIPVALCRDQWTPLGHN